MNADLFGLVLGKLKLSKLIEMQCLSKDFKKIIRETKWTHLVKIKKLNYISYVINNYNFIRYDFGYSEITDFEIIRLGNLKYLDLTCL